MDFGKCTFLDNTLLKSVLFKGRPTILYGLSKAVQEEWDPSSNTTKGIIVKIYGNRKCIVYCLVKCSSKSKHTIQYPNIPSTVRPAPHNKSLPIPMAPKTYTLQPEMGLEDSGPSKSTDYDEEYPADLVH
ncbi:hypothetical protein AVEN_236726-1 [Araneus ventricosus]|uniref:Uncharacterized protein n=1 Tax=Araneus ventricosus TaxID=182803 RepID=A0A4Y2JR88_ARAVE|nr:hypothetical protein AVEN_236726-1 [Araneus ventricosus]